MAGQVTDLAASAERLHTDKVVMMKNQMEMEEVRSLACCLLSYAAWS